MKRIIAEGTHQPDNHGDEPKSTVLSPKLLRRLGRFGMIGLANVGVDLSIYVSLLLAGCPIWLSKAIAFLAGTIFAYFANRIFTFDSPNNSIRDFYAVILLYTITMLVNVSVNSFSLYFLSESRVGIFTSYCVAVGISATMNFIGMQYIFLQSKSKDGKP